MAVQIVMPQLGMTMDEGKLLEWIKTEKESVQKGEIFFVIESDKVTYEVESPGNGLLVRIKDAGEVFPVGAILGYLADSEAEYRELRRAADGAASGMSVTPADTEPGETPAPEIQGSDTEEKVRATPGARKLAKQKGIDLAAVTGTGPQGRVTREDVENAERTASSKVPNTEQPAEAAFPKIQAAFKGGKKIRHQEPMSGMRATISRRMMESLQRTAQMTAFAEWDVTALTVLRKQINQSLEKSGADYQVTVPGMMMVFLARVLREMPVFNASVEADTITYWEDVNIGVAVAVPDGLVVPVVQGVDRKSLGEIQLNLSSLIDKARNKKLLPDDMSGGTFTLSNLGSYGSGLETVVLNPPEVALLGIGRGEKKPVVVNDQIVIREMMPVSLTFDHRVIDGATAGAFRNRLKLFIENPGFLITA